MNYIVAKNEDIDLAMEIRLEMLREVNGLSDDNSFDGSFVATSRKFFMDGNQTTVLAMEDEVVCGCATICYINVMPTYSHPTGKRAHLMNVYTKKANRRHGVANQMIGMLIDEAKEKGVQRSAWMLHNREYRYMKK